MKLEVKDIPFNGSTLLGVKDASGQVWLAVRKTCMGIYWLILGLVTVKGYKLIFVSNNRE